MKELKIGVPDGKKAEWKDIDGTPTLVLVDEKDERPVIERIKTLDDAIRELGESNPLVIQFKELTKGMCDGELTKDLFAYFKLRIIAAALNEGWKPKFTTDEYCYYPWFYFYTEEELAQKSEQWKKEHKLWLFGGVSNSGAYCGLAGAGSSDVWSLSYAHFSARLAVKSEELAIYFGKQFIDIWANYVGPFGE